jgi:hypothetical protein
MLAFSKLGQGGQSAPGVTNTTLTGDNWHCQLPRLNLFSQLRVRGESLTQSRVNTAVIHLPHKPALAQSLSLYFNNYRDLDLEVSVSNEKQLAWWARKTQGMRNVTKLNFSWRGLGREFTHIELVCLAKIVANLSKLKHCKLNFKFTKFTSNSLRCLSSSLKGAPLNSVEFWFFFCYGFNPDTSQLLANLLRRQPSLAKLSFGIEHYDAQWQIKANDKLIISLPQLTNLRVLELGLTFADYPSLIEMAQRLAQLKQLEVLRLDLYYCGEDDQVSMATVVAAIGSLTNLHTLELSLKSKHSLQLKVPLAFAHTWGNLSKLRSLKLELLITRQAGKYNLSQISQLLTLLPQLAVVKLKLRLVAQLSSSEIANFARSLGAAKQLTKLELSVGSIESTLPIIMNDWAQVLREVASRTTLSNLRLHFDGWLNCEDPEHNSFPQALAQLPHVQQLAIAINPCLSEISQFYQRTLTAITCLPKLESLTISDPYNYRYCSEIYFNLANGLVHLPRLKQIMLDFGENVITAHSAAELSSLLTKLSTLEFDH